LRIRMMLVHFRSYQCGLYQKLNCHIIYFNGDHTRLL